MTFLTQTLSGSGRDGAYDAVLKWVLFTALMILSAVVSYDYGLLNYLFEADKSRISVVIAALFLAFCAHALWILLEMAREYRQALMIQRVLTEEGATTDRQALVARLTRGTLIEGFMSDYLRALSRSGHKGAEEMDAHLLLQSLAASLRRRTKIGVWGTDLLYKLGMLGTMVGFVMMLNSMGDMADFDVETLRLSLQKMIAGMAVSLLTTIAGLIGGILLRFQYMLAEGLATDISQTAIRITEVTLPPRSSEAK
jgi:MotA/TolQ/ExbB proton channel family